MKPVLYLTAACVVSLAMAATAMPAIATELLLGMAAPLVAGVATLVMVEHTYRRDPAALTPLMIKAFGTKLVLFGGYVATVVGLTPLDPIPFVASFCVYFIGLHLTEAWLLRSLFARTF